MRKLLLFLALLLFASSAKAACTGSSPSWTASPDPSSITTCISNAVTGDTITVTAGTITNATLMNIPSTKGITIIASGAVIISSTSEGFILNAGASTTRISGFTCNRAGNVPTDFNGHCLQINTAPGNATYRIDHWTMCSGGGTCTTANTIFVTITGVGPGLFDHNTLSGNGASFIQENGTGSNQTVTTEWADDVVPGGSAMLFFEDNTITNSVGTSTETSNGWIQGVGGTRTVIRHNTFNMIQIDQHGSQNGGAECTGGGSACTGNVGVRWYEIYNNTFVVCAGCGWFSYMDLRAGSGVIFNNTITGSNTSWGFIRIYEENTLPWPQAYQPGSGRGDITSPHASCSSGTQNTSPIYLWTGTGSPINTGTVNSTAFNIKLDNGNSSTVGNVQLNRDLFVSSLQPATLRRLQISGDTCSTTYNYAPFTYPHPLIGSTIPTIAITAPASGATVSGNVTLTGTCVPSGATITSVQFQIDGQNYGAAGSTSPYSPAAWDSTTASNAPSIHTIAFTCTDSNGLQNTTSEPVTVSNSMPGCFVSSNDWSANQTFNPAAATFTATFTVKINNANSNTLVGLSQGAANANTSLAAIILFNPGGVIQVRNGGTYTADNVVSIVPGTVYTFSMTVNITNHTYSVQETSPSNVSLATNYAFRTEQATVAGLDTVNEQGVTGTPNTEQLCNFAVAPVVAFAPVPLNFNNVTQGSTKALTETVSNISFPSTETLGNSPHYYTITGANATDFTVTGGGLTDGGTISGGNSGTSVITFTPATCVVSTGCQETATLTILGTAGGTVTLNGTGFPIPTQPAPSAPAAILSYISNGSMLLTITNAPKCATICTVTLACQGACKPTFGVTIQ